MAPGSSDRGYGHAHRKLRLKWVAILKRDGSTPCHKCGQPIVQGMKWDLGHTDDRRGWTGPEHIYCNRADGARRGNRMRAGARPDARHPVQPETEGPRRSRDWFGGRS